MMEELYNLLSIRQVPDDSISNIFIEDFLIAIDKNTPKTRKVYDILQNKYQNVFQKSMKDYFKNLYQLSEYLKIKELENENIFISLTKYFINYLYKDIGQYVLVFMTFLTSFCLANIIVDHTYSWSFHTKLISVNIVIITLFYYLYVYKRFLKKDY